MRTTTGLLLILIALGAAQSLALEPARQATLEDAALKAADAIAADGDPAVARDIYAALAGSAATPAVQAEAQAAFERIPEPIALFDGNTFEGWEGDQTWFRIEDGAIVAGKMTEPIPHNTFLCTTREFGDFVLHLKVKIVGGDTANAGIQLRSRRVPDNHEVSGYQADMGQKYWGCLYDESRRNKVLAGVDQALLDRVLNQGEWNDYLIRCEGRRIRLWLNGSQTVDYIETEEGIADSGIIGLQVHGGPASEAWYKDIVLTPIAAK